MAARICHLWAAAEIPDDEISAQSTHDLTSREGRLAALREIAERYFRGEERADPAARALLELMRLHDDVSTIQAETHRPDPAHVVAWLTRMLGTGTSGGPSEIVTPARLGAVAEAVLSAFGLDGCRVVSGEHQATAGLVPIPQQVVASQPSEILDNGASEDAKE